MDKYRLVPNEKQYYTDNNYMNYQYGTPFYEGGEQSSRQAGSGGFQYGDARMPGFPSFDTGLFPTDEGHLLDDKRNLEYIQQMQQIAASDLENSTKGKKNSRASNPKGTSIPVDKKVKKNGKGPAAKQPVALTGKASTAKDAVDELEMKRMKRLLRNRVSAQLARERKKQYVLGLEKSVKESDKKIKELHDTIQRLMKENEALKHRLV